MLKKRIAYTDYNGNLQEEDFYFNLSKADLAEMELTTVGGMQAYLKQIVNDQNGSAIIETFKMFIGRSVGIRTEDGKRFMRSDEITRAFMETPAYEELFMELVTNAQAGVDFVKGILPNDLARRVEDIQLPEPTQYSSQELIDMDDAKFYEVVGENPRNWSKEQMVIAMQRKNHLTA